MARILILAALWLGLWTKAAFAGSLPPAVPGLPGGDFILANAERYCEREPADCELPKGPATMVELDRHAGLLRTINAQINASLSFRLDSDQYGQSDFWVAPGNGKGPAAGDCEDYALAKRQLLMEAGVDARNLRITLVRFNENGRTINHAILAVLTDRGTRYLDMNTDMVGDQLALMLRFGYRFVAMQSGHDFAVFSPMAEPPTIRSASAHPVR